MKVSFSFGDDKAPLPGFCTSPAWYDVGGVCRCFDLLLTPGEPGLHFFCLVLCSFRDFCFLTVIAIVLYRWYGTISWAHGRMIGLSSYWKGVLWMFWLSQFFVKDDTLTHVGASPSYRFHNQILGHIFPHLHQKFGTVEKLERLESVFIFR